ncbi:DUF2294 domain-containing protein [Lyngbya sp. PCC 8106]|uniref:DUF2294 domain-containing protein n=1 Tax=Lyngbya sp. (strain PCC 8106) TaxID=313612 RepID=UPI0000EAD1BB|nr:DUF2294 domain-containing protein [Lyngbya sp. PCC 8106]EAW38250.1 hypothetical protein L8106_09511 [Lyngbya sp. PCC 8106]
MNYPTRGQLERHLSQQIQALYRQELGHQPSKVTCQLFDCKLAVIVENSITPAEKRLAEVGQEDLAEEVRAGLKDATQPKLKALIQEILGVEAIDILSEAKLETGRLGIIVILAQSPQVRNPEAIPKHKANNGS